MTEERVETPVQVYEAPAIIYEGKITSRAGSAAPVPGDGDTLNLFGD